MRQARKPYWWLLMLAIVLVGAIKLPSVFAAATAPTVLDDIAKFIASDPAYFGSVPCPAEVVLLAIDPESEVGNEFQQTIVQALETQGCLVDELSPRLGVEAVEKLSDRRAYVVEISLDRVASTVVRLQPSWYRIGGSGEAKSIYLRWTGFRWKRVPSRDTTSFLKYPCRGLQYRVHVTADASNLTRR